jgi:hypothetical protein
MFRQVVLKEKRDASPKINLEESRIGNTIQEYVHMYLRNVMLHEVFHYYSTAPAQKERERQKKQAPVITHSLRTRQPFYSS